MKGEFSAEAHAAAADKAGLVRTIAGGIFMGVANIIPGVSGGTMILAFGLYQRFVDSVADVTRLKFRPASIIFLGILGSSAGLAILASVGPINWGMEHHQHIMFAGFIGLTLGGVPIIRREMVPMRASGVASAAGGVTFMILLTFALKELDLPANFLFLFLGGIIGSAAMVLPGISGSLLLLALGLYSPITEGIHEFKEALKALDVGAAMEPIFGVILPVGLGVLIGIAGLANILKALLHRYHQPTMGCLLGLLLGSVFFLYPFKEPGHKDPFAEAAEMTPLNLVLVALALAAGLGITYALSHLGPDKASK